MFQQDLQDGYIKRDPWVKAMKKAYLPEEIVELIKKRINNPSINGPITKISSGENDTDIINTFIERSQDYKKKIVPAVGLLLFNLLNEKEPESHELLRGVFSIIANSKLKECSLLMRKWLLAKKEAMQCDDLKWKTTYREGELPTLIKRDYDKGAYLMASMWNDEKCREVFEKAIAKGLNENNGWAGIAVNQVLEKLDDEKKNELLLGLRKIVYYA